ncbi:hypothetical protein [Vulcanisaeta distributa]|uniref:hypothetical protein n=1 Tax=Vulcanisaeta distributa TaxID=164451 RepID=UPI0006D21844|nr:hypothetical protein [Vulcanisaeta distributa]
MTKKIWYEGLSEEDVIKYAINTLIRRIDAVLNNSQYINLPNTNPYEQLMMLAPNKVLTINSLLDYYDFLVKIKNIIIGYTYNTWLPEVKKALMNNNYKIDPQNFIRLGRKSFYIRFVENKKLKDLKVLIRLEKTKNASVSIALELSRISINVEIKDQIHLDYNIAKDILLGLLSSDGGRYGSNFVITNNEIEIHVLTAALIKAIAQSKNISRILLRLSLNRLSVTNDGKLGISIETYFNNSLIGFNFKNKLDALKTWLNGKLDVNLMATLTGFYLGDGFIDSNKRRTGFTMSIIVDGQLGTKLLADTLKHIGYTLMDFNFKRSANAIWLTKDSTYKFAWDLLNFVSQLEDPRVRFTILNHYRVRKTIHIAFNNYNSHEIWIIYNKYNFKLMHHRSGYYCLVANTHDKARMLNLFLKEMIEISNKFKVYLKTHIIGEKLQELVINRDSLPTFIALVNLLCQVKIKN